MKIIITHGIRRSGNHFIISVILHHFKNYVHINDTILSHNNFLKYKNIEKTVSRIDGKYTGFKNVDCVLLSIEDNINIKELNKFTDAYKILILRNPYCNMSSIWKIYNKKINETTMRIKLWEKYYNLFTNNNDLIKVLYDEFTVNDNYKINILKQIGIDNINFNNITNIKYQGSSFLGNPSQSKQVYKNLDDCIYSDDNTFIELFNNTNINSLWLNIKTIVCNNEGYNI